MTQYHLRGASGTDIYPAEVGPVGMCPGRERHGSVECLLKPFLLVDLWKASGRGETEVAVTY